MLFFSIVEDPFFNAIGLDSIMRQQNISAKLLNEALHIVIKLNKTDSINPLLHRGADVNYINLNGSTPLHIATENNQIQIVERLLDHHANYSMVNKENNTALDLAEDFGHVKIIHSLKRHIIVTNNANHLRLLEELKVAISKGKLNIVQDIIEQGITPDTYISKDKTTALHQASIMGHIEIVKYLIQEGADINAVDKNNATALHYALMNNTKKHQKIIETLLYYGADYNITPLDDYNFFYKIAARGYHDLVNKILNKIDNIDEIQYGTTALHAAASNTKIHTMALILEKGADVTLLNSDKNYSQSVLDILNLDRVRFISAAANNKIKLMESLLDQGANINDHLYYGHRALDLAVKNGHKQAAEYLLEHGAAILPGLLGYTPLHIAARQENYEMMDLLLIYGANPYYENFLGQTPLDMLKLDQSNNF